MNLVMLIKGKGQNLPKKPDAGMALAHDHDRAIDNYYQFGHLEGLFDPETSFERAEMAARRANPYYSLAYAAEWSANWLRNRRWRRDCRP